MVKVIFHTLSFFILLCFVAACSGDGDGLISEFKDPKEYQSFEKPTEKEAMMLLYRAYQSNEKTEWSAELLPEEKEIQKFAGQKKISTSIIGFKSIETADKEYLLMITSSNIKDNDCPVCTPFIGGFLFVKTDRTWKLEVIDYYFAEIGSNGVPDEIKIFPSGKNAFPVCIAFSGEDQSSGGLNYTVIYTIFKGAFTESLNLVTYNTDIAENDEEWEYSAKYEMISGVNDDYSDIQVSTSGTQYDDAQNKIVSMNNVELFTYKNGKYVKKK